MIKPGMSQSPLLKEPAGLQVPSQDEVQCNPSRPKNPGLDQPTTSSGNKVLGLPYYRPKLPFTISPKEVLPFPQVEDSRPEKKDDKRKGKTAIITASPYKL